MDAEGAPPIVAALDPDQRAAVVAPPGAVLVVAGAGSGKTRTLTHRAAWATSEWGLEPERVLVVSFTNKAVDEMIERLRALIGDDAALRMVCRTFHAAAWQLCVRPHRQLLGRPVQTIYSHEQSLTAMRRAMKQLSVAGSAGAMLSRVGWAKSHGLCPGELAALGAEDAVVADVWRGYRDELRAAWAVDFEDLMVIAVHLLERHPEVRHSLQQRFGAVLLDEYQDASPVQHRWARLIAGKAPNVTAVGDLAQALYSFRGGNARGMLEFERDYPGARRLVLERNYRSRAAIVDAAGRLIGHDTGRFGTLVRATRPGGRRSFSSFGDQGEEAEAIAAWALEQLEAGREPAELAVLARTGHYTHAIEQTLVREEIPYRVLGRLRLLEHAEIRDVLALLELVDNPHSSDALQRASSRIRGLGARTLSVLVSASRELGVSPVALARDAARIEALGPSYREKVNELARRVALVRGALDADGIAAAIDAAQLASGWREDLAEAEDADEVRRRSRLGALSEIARHHEGASVEEFLAELRLGSSEEERGPELAIATIHAAKGLEWPCVAVVGAVEGVLPHRRSIDQGAGAISEERRVAYVALTRAMDALWVSAAARVGPRREQAPVSRFVAEAGLAPGP